MKDTIVEVIIATVEDVVVAVAHGEGPVTPGRGP
jgi:hypothetical protein